MAVNKRNQNKRSNILVITEALLIAYIGYITHFILTQIGLSSQVPIEKLLVNTGLLTVAILLCSLSVGLYEAKLRETFRGIIRRIFVSVGLSYFLVEVVSRALFDRLLMDSYFLPASVSAIIITLVVFRYFTNRLGLLGLGKVRIIVLGAGERASIIEKRMRRDVDRIGFELVGFIPIPGDNREDGIHKEKIIHVKVDENFQQFIADNEIEEIVIACDQRRGTLPVEVLFDCRLRGIEVTELLDFMERETGQIVVNLMYPSWVIYSNGFKSQNYLRDALDYSINAILAFIIFFFVWPIMLATAIIIYFDDGRRTGVSVFYKQERVGLNGQLFKIIKFRSMRPDAEKDGAKWASKNDDRVTRIGHFIRKYRVDELPQLLNVFKGEMSFIGPRPERPEFVEQLVREVPYYNQRHNVKPGLAGWAQLNYPYGASVEDSMEKLKFDLYYVKHQSLLLDILILIRTVEVVLFGKGR
ncbi:sugar transferase domain-containing protein [Alteromonas macleodii str. 'Black Sea 11']|uniref:TIGR03013 family XrtA/PEP-CTERM system glycosyltransferase n=1 Tax=Alteromonas abrolhosensis TaxID=1892904 RepID=UPI000286E4FE|nr:TIGR03013 family XrtA/PEP-CTERM system glycosyltransferase [Alteromonas abrolhosensis]AFT79208.1 sugar transferase domain-containing protein [Alteromonas macleodii str. 'Black Sea 11']NKX04564.1 TIGR03013 family PEP-CTERM/XrtA system glycosyltransferase [Alteromonadaceae bacterium A_SAG6]NKX33803.1 TIGR03013 family PEP-CTERM/XrtA system glycosyltransferase [Alteromonadaceae bacterium A_SAG3]NKX68995.1 TIGR03013 family PEP-CTERM/XrtA system glycosyltransferase [Alteromonadaceae bacterium A_SA